MAGDWIKLERATPDKPEVWGIAEALGIEPDAVMGKLLRVWFWFDEQTEDGNARSVTNETLLKRIDALTGVAGFADAMQKVGWLNGTCIPNFDRHNGKSAKSRALSYQRVKRHRNAGSVTPALLETETENRSPTTTSGRPDARLPFKGQAREVLAFLNEKTGRHYQAVRANLEMIEARLKDGATIDELRAVVAKKCREWTGNEKMAPYLRPATLFNRTKFAQYQGELHAVS
jgi:uncharacterized phage protein (TIGR02220 family)